MLRIEGCPETLRRRLCGMAEAANPVFQSALRVGRSPGEAPETIRLWREESGVLVLPRGLTETARQEALRVGVPVEIEDRRQILPSIDLQFRGTLRPYQEKALAALCRFGSGILSAPCGSGKTATLAALIAARRQPALVLAHTVDLARQLRKDLSAWLGTAVGLIGGGVFSPTGRVDVGVLQSLFSEERRSEASGWYGLLAIDECHHTPARCFCEVAQAFPAVFRYGLSATPERGDGLTRLLAAVLGHVRHVVRAAELEEAGVRVRPTLRWAQGIQVPEWLGPENWAELVGYLAKSPERLRIVADITCGLVREGRAVLALLPRVEAAEAAAALLTAKGVSAEVVHGGVARKERSSRLDRVKSGVSRVLCAVLVADEGLDLPCLSAVVLAAPSRSATKGVQRIGRALRPVEGKRNPAICDLVDDSPILRAQARDRFFKVHRLTCEGAQLPEWLERKGGSR